ncbi:2-oxoglutarate dehydrogenase complex dihydrolipoyllysine-residue succinyltransferase [Sinimarinibacterium flocculans]|uniref:Dihydrolipoyllysine-residue succinyltransferase component of 2-oxoglutarate dehydrogenase complex n=1 Tax=Sinimarinibacterium flocculans TaxID=985250 RepID=A0A318EEY6_9GAMM|nr:2-oxoglutarate dehydrogenase complex dihydrolipoyllysine-residue succinyltransferase [Sinimarinibacterium flocculans]PXV68562.1 2-oxoglutarate dehydrogenase E2 component [Sinimarinibacterium flocculans]
MAIEIKVPNLPESVSSATVATWHVQQGDAVAREQNLLDLETDKVMLEVPAVEGGVLKEIRVQAGATVQAGDVLGVIEAGAAAPEKKAEAAAPAKAEAPAKAAPTAAADNESQSPAVRKLLSELGLAAADIPASGRGGRLTVEDVRTYAEQQKSKPAAQPSAPKATAPAPARLAPGAREEQRVPMTRIRARIAERLLDAKNNTAMLTTFNEVDLKAVSELRARYKDSFEKAHGAKLGFMSFFVRAAIEALKKYPVLNASVDGNDIVYHGYYDIGIAVSSERGLVVPIMRDADMLSMAEIEKTIGDFGSRAKANKLTMEDLTGGTFSITNGGVFGSMLSTPILNPPQSAILGMHGITERPVVVDGQIVIRPMMYLALSYDHRIIDGKEAVLGLRTIKECLEDPAKILLQL